MLHNILNKLFCCNQRMQNGGKSINIILIRNYVASLYLEKGDLAEAKRHIDENMRIAPKNSDTYVRLANFHL